MIKNNSKIYNLPSLDNDKLIYVKIHTNKKGLFYFVQNYGHKQIESCHSIKLQFCDIEDNKNKKFTNEIKFISIGRVMREIILDLRENIEFCDIVFAEITKDTPKSRIIEYGGIS